MREQILDKMGITRWSLKSQADRLAETITSEPAIKLVVISELSRDQLIDVALFKNIIKAAKLLPNQWQVTQQTQTIATKFPNKQLVWAIDADYQGAVVTADLSALNHLPEQKRLLWDKLKAIS
ncbi:DNA polymerase III subunit psi [Paraferrimonas sp. SM1919]|uniref:DNA polymerase III subunit psi n=1 Tax=Paraferrimonas sp. SM1919 TaxID=2662263 RepID=UPI0013D6CB2B|nr:DNA polymerase III subunit psi [Paraferrimonas sp. SM1919]